MFPQCSHWLTGSQAAPLLGSWLLFPPFPEFGAVAAGKLPGLGLAIGSGGPLGHLQHLVGFAAVKVVSPPLQQLGVIVATPNHKAGMQITSPTPLATYSNS